jgi:hypothetical protein
MGNVGYSNNYSRAKIDNRPNLSKTIDKTRQ